MSTHHSGHDDASHGSVRSYVIGFVLAVVLTVAAFMVATSGALSPTGALTAISVLAAVQVVVHLIYFLHMNTTAENRWNNNVFLFTVMVVAIFIVGTAFIMTNTSAHMMSR
ncbi:cytochrome o ubiquinol oxidase subunit IV [Acetobacter nitrogenifigens DSM 23921 = NBRC 105050]|uniref:Cytochrome bo(3) ubiquinol oxidase subunit 4 n=2 Tax=Acetobacter TaxID=434 RepID=A0A511X712_9PROT|nr:MULTISPECIES: cytochrome o ubiquinol oxidase subunit IV [Acetobacter]MBO1358416.1 cytochrome o ubiquinol oxidase subunit IV [Acetobacter sacchari]OUJ15616.1 cytochrome C oxidase subunit III [Acetobacter sp. DsW_063]GBQ95150.1 cytochrome o ubiquinol oxidase subunit IV [Acetobacter nitrogenifigens DSM 23921 = NBRC 105050]GEN58730.1 cytochrome o ubiquinol oxidase subunit IV [Acetobacter nitrogenifigens DSM 23921 = NBRC 105050]